MLSRSSSIADISLLNCFRLAAITCSSSVCVDPIHSKLNSFKLFANVLWHRDKSMDRHWKNAINKKKGTKEFCSRLIMGNEFQWKPAEHSK